MGRLLGSFSSFDWDMNTFYLYLCIILISFVLSKCFATNIEFTHNQNKIRISFAVFLPTILILCVKCFVYCGTDLLSGYKMNFETAKSMSQIYDYSLEYMYKVLNVLVHRITNNYEIFIIVVGVITVVPISRIFEKYMKYIAIPYAIMVYTSIFFFQSFSLMRIYIAATIGLLVFDRLVEGKCIQAIAFSLFAGLWHSSGFVLVIPCLLYFFRNRKKLISLGMLFGYIFVFFERNIFANFLVGRHSGYEVNKNYTVGTEVFVYFIPLFALYFVAKYCIKTLSVQTDISKKQADILDISFLFLIFGAFLNLMQYVVNVFGRMFVYSIPITIFVACAISILQQNCKDIRWIWGVKIGVFVYCILRFVIYLNGYYKLDGIMPYSNFVFK